MKLTKQETEEGITLELVNSKGVTEKTSPVLFEKEGDVYNLLKCSAGFWAMDKNGKYVKESGKYKVFQPRDCQIARARYLLYFSENEKEAETQKLYEKRKRQAVDAIANYRKKIDEIRHRPDWFVALMSLEEKIRFNAETEEKLPLYEHDYARLEKQLNDGNITNVLVYFGIEKQTKPGELLIKAHYDNDNEMRILKGAFGKEALVNYEGDIEMHIARLRVEQRY